mmetsp:Transcript_21586/g.49411  ORF Transcript_21586/g.49411 Transcript_21586/m.49411 type:complete len:205 (-) Transcript_21586:690-1304(-)
MMGMAKQSEKDRGDANTCITSTASRCCGIPCPCSLTRRDIRLCVHSGTNHPIMSVENSSKLIWPLLSLSALSSIEFTSSSESFSPKFVITCLSSVALIRLLLSASNTLKAAFSRSSGCFPAVPPFWLAAISLISPVKVFHWPLARSCLRALKCSRWTRTSPLSVAVKIPPSKDCASALVSGNAFGWLPGNGATTTLPSLRDRST